MKQTPGKIYLSDQRGLTESEQFSRYSTFNFGEYFNEHKGPHGSLYAWNEETLAGSQQITWQVAEATYVIVLPITGDAQVVDGYGFIHTIHIGETVVLSLPTWQSFQVVNQYPGDVIHFLHIWLKAPCLPQTVVSQLYAYDLSNRENQLTLIVPGWRSMEVGPALPFSVSLGRFAGRKETVYSLKNQYGSLFTFVLAGAFEVEGRLLHAKDGLGLWEVEMVELEALSHNALILVIELDELPVSRV